MKVYKFYDYIFFRLASYYERQHGNDDRFGSIILLSFTQSANLFTIISFIFMILEKKIALPYYVTVISGIVLFSIFNAIRYKFFITYQNLKNSWCNENESIRFKRGFYVIMYMVLSLLLSALLSTG